MTNRTSGTNQSELEVGGDRQDELFAALSHPRRRFALQFLRGVDAPLGVAELAGELATWEGNTTATDKPGGKPGDVEVSLTHVHLPKMADAGLVSYDTVAGTVALADRSGEARTHLRAMTTE